MLAKSITEMHDAQDSPVPVLKGALAGISKTYGGKVRYDVDPKPGEPGHYEVFQLKKKEVDGDYTPSRKDGGKYTEPGLPPKTIVQENGVTIEHYTRSGDHGPPHLHVKGGGPETKIGQNGKPIDGSPELTPVQKRVVEKNLSSIRLALKKIGAYFRFNNYY